MTRATLSGGRFCSFGSPGTPPSVLPPISPARGEISSLARARISIRPLVRKLLAS